MKSHSFADKETGLFSGVHFSTSNSEMLEANTPAGHFAVEGHYDHLSQRADIATGEVVDYQPPRPSVDHEWNDTTKRWEMSAASQAKIDARSAALAGITALEAQGIRAMREAQLGVAGSQERLAGIDAQIAQLRRDL